MNQDTALFCMKEHLRCSDDPDTQTACVIVQPGPLQLTMAAANQLPDGVERRSNRVNRPAKYAWIMHAEKRAISMAAREGFRLLGSTMYLNWFPCSDCAQSIVQAGIAVLWCDRKAYDARKGEQRYGFDVSMQMLEEGGVKVEWF